MGITFVKYFPGCFLIKFDHNKSYEQVCNTNFKFVNCYPLSGNQNKVSNGALNKFTAFYIY